MRDTRYRFHGSATPVRRSQLQPRNFAPENVGDASVAVLRLYDPIDSWGGDWGVSAREFTAALDGLDPKTEEIRLHLNTPGGEVFEAVAILNAMRRHDAKIVAIVDGIAASAGSFLAAGADETLMGRNSQLMIHDAWGLCVGNAADMRELAGQLDQLSDNIADIYASKAGGSTARWRDAMIAETWYSADEAVKAGLADAIEGAAAEPENAFDLSVFKHAGRAQAPDPVLPAEEPEPDVEQIDEPYPEPEPDVASLDTPATPTGMSALQERRHRMNVRKRARAS